MNPEERATEIERLEAAKERMLAFGGGQGRFIKARAIQAQIDVLKAKVE